MDKTLMLHEEMEMMFDIIRQFQLRQSVFLIMLQMCSQHKDISVGKLGMGISQQHTERYKRKPMEDETIQMLSQELRVILGMVSIGT